MPLPTFLREAANAALAPCGYELRRKRAPRPPLTMDGALARAQRHGFSISTMIDVGAATGTWTRRALRCFPDARYVLIDPLEERRAALEALRDEFPNIDFTIAAAGAEPGETLLNVSEDLDGSGISDQPDRAARRVPVTTLDAEVRQRACPGPFGIKLDTHGFELPILAGASTCLARTNLLIIEAYNFQLTRGCPRFHELCAHLEERGFRCYDFADPMLRERDEAFWQVDLFFTRAESPLFVSNSFR